MNTTVLSLVQLTYTVIKISYVAFASVSCYTENEATRTRCNTPDMT